MQNISNNTSIGSEFVGIYNSNNAELISLINTLTNRIKSVETENATLKKTVRDLQLQLNSKLDTILENLGN